MKIVIILSCEHAVNYVPLSYRELFKSQKRLLNSHQAIDFGAFEVATILSKKLSCSLISASVTRLLIDCNRSLGHRASFSFISRVLPEAERQKIIEDYYLPFRASVKNEIQAQIDQGHKVLHLSMHSFTAKLKGKTRKADIGLLYDPKRQDEKSFAHILQKELQHKNFLIRRNYPYQGISDGFTSALRQKYSQEDYLGLEIEINQNLLKTSQDYSKVGEILASSLDTIV